MTLEVQVAKPIDGPQLAAVFFDAFSHEFDRKMLPPNEPEVRAFMEKTILGDSESSEKGVTLKVVDPAHPDVIAGFAKWVFPIRGSDASHDSRPDQKPPNWPKGADPDLCKVFFSTMERNHKNVMGERPHYYLDILGVHPSYQGRGLASKLLKWGLGRADQEGLEVYLAASPSGRPVYEKKGFKVVGNPSSPYPGYVQVCMLRPVQSKKE